jgi:hypothetical protein
VYPNGYTFTGNKVNFARNITAGSNIVIQNNISPAIEEFESSVADFNIAAQYVQGTRLFFRNTHPSVSLQIIAPPSETINGVSSIPLAFNHGVAVRKISTTAWITESENNPARLSDIAPINYWTLGTNSVWRPTANVGIGTSLESQITDRLTIFGPQPFIKISNNGFGTNLLPQRAGISFFGAGGANKFGEISLLDRSADNGFGNLDFRVSNGTLTIQTALSLNGNGLTVTAPSLAGAGNRLIQANAAGVLQPTTADVSSIPPAYIPANTFTGGTSSAANANAIAGGKVAGDRVWWDMGAGNGVILLIVN